MIRRTPPRGLGPQPAAPDRLVMARSLVRNQTAQVVGSFRRWSDPRERELRRRWRMRRRGIRWGALSGITSTGAVVSVLVAAPEWLVVAAGAGGVLMGVRAAVSVRGYLQVRGAPLPRPAFVPRQLPPGWSASHGPMTRLAWAERSLYELGNRIAFSERLPAEELEDLLDTAAHGAATLAVLAGDISAMERAASSLSRSPSSAAGDLRSPVARSVERLNAGVTEYEHLVAAAGQVVAGPGPNLITAEYTQVVQQLRDATDRMAGWAHAWRELTPHQPPSAPPFPQPSGVSLRKTRPMFRTGQTGRVH